MNKFIQALLAIILLTVACTKEDGILERPAYSFYKISFSLSTTSERFFELVVDDKVVSDSVTTNGQFEEKISSGNHRFQLRKHGSSSFFLDTVLTLDKAQRITFDFMNIDEDADPIIFNAGETDPPSEGFYKFSIINISKTGERYYGRNLDITFYELDPITYELIYAANLEIPKSTFSSYLQLSINYANSLDAIYVLGIKDKDTGEIIDNELDYSAFFYPLKDPNSNTYLLKFNGAFGTLSSKKL